MSGSLQLYKVAKDKDFLKKLDRTENVPIIIGSELYISLDLAERDVNNKYSNITVLVKNNAGYRNLCHLTSIASLPDHFYSRPRISLAELFQYKEGLIVTSSSFYGLIPKAIHLGTGKEEELFKLFKEEFGDDFYVEIHLRSLKKSWDKTLKQHIDQESDPLEKVNIRLFELANQYNVKVVLAQDSHMPKKEHHFVQTIMIKNAPANKDGWHFPEAYFTMSVAEMYDRKNKVTTYLADLIDDAKFVEYCENSIEILNKCKDLKLEFSPQLPTIDYASHPLNLNDEFEKKLNDLDVKFKDKDPDFVKVLKFSKRDIALRTALKVIVSNNKIDLDKDDYRQRLTYELNTIQMNGVIRLIDYFMLLEDVTRYGREKEFFRGFGRGSAAGCLLAFALDITDVDPLIFELLFERFLTKDRIGFLDFSIEEVPKQ
jgi:DNA polymerase-3 subunit alpha